MLQYKIDINKMFNNKRGFIKYLSGFNKIIFCNFIKFIKSG